MIQVVLVSFLAVATPYCVSDLLPVVPAPAKYIVSDVIAIVTTLAVMFVNVIQVPTGYATLAFESMVNVRAFVSVEGWSIDLPESAATVVYAAL